MNATNTHSRFSLGTLAWPLLGIFLLMVVNVALGTSFFELEVRDGHLYGTLVDVVHQGSKVALLAVGMSLVIATGGVDLSVGSLMAVAGAVAALLVTAWSWPFPAALLASLACCGFLGAVNGGLVAGLGLQPIVATLVLMVVGRGMAMLLTDGQIITFEDPAFVYLANGHLLGLPFTVTLLALVYLLAWLVVRRTAVGLMIEAVGDSERAGRLCGVPVRGVQIVVYAVSGCCAGLAGLVAASNIKAADGARAGEMMELDAILAVVLGGTSLTGGRFTLAGSLLGALLIQTLTTTLYNLGVPPAVAPLPKALLILVVCLGQSERLRALLRRGGAAGRNRR